jgi:hypothetical protein
LRINQLPHSAKELEESKKPTALALPALGDALDQDLADATAGGSAQAREDAQLCVDKLNRDPNNIPARERLARLLAQRLDQPAAGIEQLNLLLNVPDQPEIKRAEWLATTAAWQLKYLNDMERGRFLLQRVINEFPESAQALAAERRLRLLRTTPDYRAPRFKISAE